MITLELVSVSGMKIGNPHEELRYRALSEVNFSSVSMGVRSASDGQKDGQ